MKKEYLEINDTNNIILIFNNKNNTIELNEEIENILISSNFLTSVWDIKKTNKKQLIEEILNELIYIGVFFEEDKEEQTWYKNKIKNILLKWGCYA